MKHVYSLLIFCSGIFVSGYLKGAFTHTIGEYTFAVSGCINPEISVNTRQVSSGRTGQEVLYPQPRVYDAESCDINSVGDTTLSPLNSRMKLHVAGPPAFGSDQTDMVLSTDFRGVSDDVREVARLCKSYIHFRWHKTHLTCGQDNHPMYLDDCSPNRVSYAGAAPFEGNTRVPQIKVIKEIHNQEKGCTDELWLQLYSHGRGLRDLGPEGPGTQYIRNAHVPAIALQWRKFYKSYVFGLLGGYKRILPRLESSIVINAETKKYKDTHALNSGYIGTYVCSKTERAHIQTKALYLWGGGDTGMFSGYGVDQRSAHTGRQTYTNLRTLSLWGDIEWYGHCYDSFAPGLFIGFSANKGASNDLYTDPTTNEPIVYATEKKLDYLFRLAPRVWWESGPVKVGCEVTWDRAAYGTMVTSGKIQDAQSVNNINILVGLFYYF